MAPWTLDVKFPCDTQFTLGSLMFATVEDGNLRILPLGPALECLAPAYGQIPCFPIISSTTGSACSGLDHYEEPHICTIKIVQGIPIVMSILQPSAGASSLSSSAASPDQDSADDYPQIRGSTCEDPTEEGCLIIMVAPAGGPS
jgi:hypothetical protein